MTDIKVPVVQYRVQASRLPADHDLSGLVESAVFGLLGNTFVKVGQSVRIEINNWFSIGEIGVEVVATLEDS